MTMTLMKPLPSWNPWATRQFEHRIRKKALMTINMAFDLVTFGNRCQD